ncbi:MAG: insulinase family protein [Candidatus Schekmanbacteria bacterium]|nr:insulinase family protein [Candidatus Schekmanbacteria bacterium]
MRTRLRFVAAAGLLWLLASAPAVPAQEAKLAVEEHTLKNGMHFLFVERHQTPTVSGGWAAHVGSANETYGQTGIAHLFEHMMFKGTTTVNTKDFAKERPIMEKLDAVRAELAAEYEKVRAAKRLGEFEGEIYDPEKETPRIKELRAQLKKLQDEQSALVVKEEWDGIYEGQGSSSKNAFTTNDVTVYIVKIPANKLELWFWMESERLRDAVLREFYAERDVVREERRMRVESDPTAAYDEQFEAMFWTATPYHHPVIGWPADVESISREQGEAFFSTYYAPNNLTGVLVGDFDPKIARELAEKYFGRLPRGQKVPPVIVTEEIEQLAERRMAAAADTNPKVFVRWRTVPAIHKDSGAFKVAAGLLQGRAGRLYKSLVEEQGIATGEPGASAGWPQRLGGYMELDAELAEGHGHAEIEAALLAEIERLRTVAVGEQELQRVKNQTLADSYRRLEDSFYLMIQLAYFAGLGDWRLLETSTSRVLAVTAEDVLRVAAAYLTPERKNVLWYSRKAGAPEDPELAGLDARGKGFVKQALAQLEAIADATQLAKAVEELRSMGQQVPAEMKPAVDIAVRRGEERLKKLQAATSSEEAKQ